VCLLRASEGKVEWASYTNFRNIPKNIFSLEPSSGGFSAAAAVGLAADISEVVDGAVDGAGEGSKAEEPDEAEAIPKVQIRDVGENKYVLKKEVQEQKM
jgi:hypothetical protein